jgi:N-acetyl-gamma-glutamyl-phosphate/LysW-gamma-L-alpha-aminoadipyl-6-phosphate reductase
LHKSVNQYRKQAGRLIDLSGDFRLRDPEVFAEWYGEKHASPDLLDEFVPGIPESYSKKLLEAYFVAMPGCMAMSSILGLKPLQEAGLLDGPIIVDAKTGSSGSGSQSSAGSHHAQRSGAMRTYKPLSHRHVAEIIQEVDPHQALGIAMSATGVEAVRGVLITAHCSAKKDATAKDLHRAYRAAYADEPFVRVVRSRTGVHRSPEPKILAGSNYCDVGFDINEDSGRLVVMSALDNLMKGGAGAAVQCMNLMFGFDQQAGLEFSGLHPA